MNETTTPPGHQPGGLTCLRLPEVRRRTGLGETAIRTLMREGQFPAPFKLGQRAIAWLESDVDAWIEARAAKRMMFRVPE
jgi:prophage regulatory protein